MGSLATISMRSAASPSSAAARMAVPARCGAATSCRHYCRPFRLTFTLVAVVDRSFHPSCKIPAVVRVRCVCALCMEFGRDTGLHHTSMGNATDKACGVACQTKHNGPPAVVDSGSNHSLLITRRGELFAWGLSSSGETGHASTRTIDVPVPRQVGPAATGMQDTCVQRPAVMYNITGALQTPFANRHTACYSRVKGSQGMSHLAGRRCACTAPEHQRAAFVQVSWCEKEGSRRAKEGLCSAYATQSSLRGEAKGQVHVLS